MVVREPISLLVLLSWCLCFISSFCHPLPIISSFPVLTTLCLHYNNSYLTGFPDFTFFPFNAFCTLIWEEKRKNHFCHVIPCSKFSSGSRSSIWYSPISNLVSSFSWAPELGRLLSLRSSQNFMVNSNHKYLILVPFLLLKSYPPIMIQIKSHLLHWTFLDWTRSYLAAPPLHLSYFNHTLFWVVAYLLPV